jgi:hypothetical protein
VTVSRHTAEQENVRIIIFETRRDFHIQGTGKTVTSNTTMSDTLILIPGNAVHYRADIYYEHLRDLSPFSRGLTSTDTPDAANACTIQFVLVQQLRTVFTTSIQPPTAHRVMLEA